jgi:hypothetical protein
MALASVLTLTILCWIAVRQSDPSDESHRCALLNISICNPFFDKEHGTVDMPASFFRVSPDLLSLVLVFERGGPDQIALRWLDKECHLIELCVI